LAVENIFKTCAARSKQGSVRVVSIAGKQRQQSFLAFECCGTGGAVRDVAGDARLLERIELAIGRQERQQRLPFAAGLDCAVFVARV
jgi:hypothetical protein